MPKIREYENDATLRPSDKGMNAVADAAQAAATSGYRVGQMQKATGEAIGSAVKFGGGIAADMYTRHVVQPEITKGGVLGAQELSRLTIEWNELAAKSDPNNSKIADEFREKKLLPAMERFKAGFQTGEGQKWADDYTTRMYTHMDNKMIADSASRAGRAAAQNVETLDNTLSSTALNDPSAMNFLMQEAENAIKGISRNTPFLSPDMAAQVETKLLQSVQKKIAQATLYGIARNNPDAAIKALESGKFNKWLDGVEEGKALRNMQILDRSEKRAQKQDAQEKLKTDVNKTFNNLIVDSIDPVSGDITIKPGFFTAIRDNAAKSSEADPAWTRAMIQFGQAEQARDKSVDFTTNPEVYKRLADGLVTGDTTLAKIVTHRNQQELSTKNFNELVANHNLLQKEPLQGPAVQQALKAAEQVIAVTAIPGVPGRDEKGAINYASFINSFIPQYQKAVREGKATAADLDVNNPNSMISQAMEPFKRSAKQKMSDYVAGLGGLTVNPDGSPLETKAAPKTNSKLPDVPAPLAGRSNNLAWSPKQGIWVDQVTRERFTKDGQPVK